MGVSNFNNIVQLKINFNLKISINWLHINSVKIKWILALESVRRYIRGIRWIHLLIE